jgi:NADPH-dependent ferric siderophore reductase
MTELKPSRGWQGAVLKLMGAGDYRLTVTGRRENSPRYLRLSFNAGGMLDQHSVHPTMWIRIWFADGHQRGYTLVEPDCEADTFDLEFALHDGCASDWARTAQPGDTIEATVMGSKFAIPDPPPTGYVIVGDTASLPAINSLLTSIDGAPARVFLQACCDEDKCLPVACSAPNIDVIWVDHDDGCDSLLEAVRSAAFDADDHFGWVACSTRTTRSVAKVLREDFGIPKKSIKAQAYWVA